LKRESRVTRGEHRASRKGMYKRIARSAPRAEVAIKLIWKDRPSSGFFTGPIPNDLSRAS
jgi:hypothetical protein